MENKPRSRLTEVFYVFFKLGCTSFGGPVAHVGYLREACVRRRGWLGEEEFAGLLALCQLLPGPTSSQLAMGIGLRRAGRLGSVAAWLGFVLPSAVVMTAAGLLAARVQPAAGGMRGLMAAAAGVVAFAVWTLARSLLTTGTRWLLAAAAMLAVLAANGPWIQAAAIAAAAGAGALALKGEPVPTPGPARPAWGWLAAFALIAAALPLLDGPNPGLSEQFAAYFRAGSLVFGGGHVVLPLLSQATVGRGWIDQEAFLSGYGVAQAMPGPLFSFFAYLGARVGTGGAAGAALALAASYLPSFLLLHGLLPGWAGLRRSARGLGALAGANAAVVGLLAAAFIHPVLTGAVTDARSLALVLAATVAIAFRTPAWAVVVGCGAAGALFFS